MININWKPSFKELRKFGLVTMIGFACISLLCIGFKGFGSVGFYFAIAGAALGAVTAIVPRLMKWFYWLWMGIAFILGNIVSRIIMAVIFYVVCTIISLLMKLTGRDRLMLKKQKTDSYWKKCAEVKNDKELYERLF